MEAAQDYDEAAEEEMLDEAYDELFEDVTDEEETAVVEEEFFDEAVISAEDDALIEEDILEATDVKSVPDSVKIIYNIIYAPYGLTCMNETVSYGESPKGSTVTSTGMNRRPVVSNATVISSISTTQP